jgi:hypothetical protein
MMDKSCIAIKKIFRPSIDFCFSQVRVGLWTSRYKGRRIYNVDWLQDETRVQVDGSNLECFNVIVG